MSQPIDRLHLLQIKAAVAAGVQMAMVQVEKLPPYMSLTEAYRLYGQGTVDRWVDEGLIEKIKDGTRNSKVRLHRESLAIIAATNNIASWSDNHEH